VDDLSIGRGCFIRSTRARIAIEAFASIAKKICAPRKNEPGKVIVPPPPKLQGSTMTTVPDYEFRLGNGRHLKGRGWRGLLALALLLTPFVVAAYHSPAWLRAVLNAVKF
jgi:hypothetical protein